MTLQQQLTSLGVALRTALYRATVNAARFNPIIKTFYDRLCAAGKPPKVARCAAARKLLLLIYAVVDKQRPFDRRYQQPSHPRRYITSSDTAMASAWHASSRLTQSRRVRAKCSRRFSTSRTSKPARSATRLAELTGTSSPSGKM
jgi:hypothetical protein